MNRTLLGILAALLLPIAAAAQQAAQPAAGPETNPVSNSVRKILERQSKNLVAAVEAMPADKYSYKPTPDQMTFGHLAVHIAETNNFLCSSITGAPAPADEKLTGTEPKEKLVAAVKSSFDYCAQTLAKMDDSNLGEQVPFFGGRKVSRATDMIILAAAASDHYGTAAIYLRLNGIVPPTAQPKKD
ncbi:MAG: DinB family protein [Candidatus Acidiferrales bacterium]